MRSKPEIIGEHIAAFEIDLRTSDGSLKRQERNQKRCVAARLSEKEQALLDRFQPQERRSMKATWTQSTPRHSYICTMKRRFRRRAP